MAERLFAWLHGTRVAVLTPARDYRITLQWHEDGIDRWGQGSTALSVGLPIGSPTGPRDMRGLDFFENILPEGPALTRMAALAGVRAVDTYGILAAFGHDCAGAIMLLGDGERAGSRPESGYVPMAGDDLRRLISTLDTAPLGAAPDRGFRPSLAGFQRKALLGRANDGTWLLPHGDAPSTWILKPDGPHAMAANEATCLRLAAACGLDVPECELLDLAGLPVLAIKRYDRRDGPADVIRVHQEDGCQATSTPPALKYAEQGGPALKDLANVLRDFGDPGDLSGLLQRTTFNMAVGNADAHAKNFSVLHSADGDVVTLAPLYDVLSTTALELTDSTGNALRTDAQLGQRVAGQRDIRKVTSADLISEAGGWGISRRTATAIVSGILERVISSARTTPGDQRVLDVIREQAERLTRHRTP